MIKTEGNNQMQRTSYRFLIPCSESSVKPSNSSPIVSNLSFTGVLTAEQTCSVDSAKLSMLGSEQVVADGSHAVKNSDRTALQFSRDKSP